MTDQTQTPPGGAPIAVINPQSIFGVGVANRTDGTPIVTMTVQGTIIGLTIEAAVALSDGLGSMADWADQMAADLEEQRALAAMTPATDEVDGDVVIPAAFNPEQDQ